MDSCLQPIKSTIIDDMNETLLKIYTKEEFKEALMQMASSKSLGLDRFNANFF